VSSGEQGDRRLFGRIRGTWDLEGRSLSFKLGLGSFGRHSPSDIRDRRPDGYRSHGYVRFREGDWLDLSLHAGMVSGDGILYVMMGDMRFSDAHNYWAMGKSQIDLGDVARLKFQVYYTKYGAWFSYRTKLRAYDMWLADVPDIFLGTGTVDGQAQLDWQLADDFLIIFGGYLRYNFLDIDNMIIRETDEFRGAGFAHVQWNPLDAVQLIGGLRLDLNTSTEAALSPRAAAVFRPWPEHHFRLGYGLAFRRPSYFENRLHSKIDDFNQATPEIVELAANQIGNEELVNEKVHSLEAGWRGRFLDDGLRVSVDLFLSFYRDTIVFNINIPSRLGLPDLSEATVRYENKGAEVNALGGEAELIWRPITDWTLWGNLGFRHVTNIDTGERMPTEPQLRVNLGVGFLPEAGPIVNIALHYVSTYKMPLMDPENTLSNINLVPLGEDLLAIGRVGYRLRLSERHTLETGLAVRTPLGHPFREYAGTPMPSQLQIDTASDFGGEELVRLVSFYLRGTF
jgi:outer membrane receptor protein involved in Fe transport